MVVFNELRITDDKQKLIIDLAIKSLPVYANMYVKTVYLDYYKNVVTMGTPSAKAIQVYNNSGNDSSVKSFRGAVDAQDLALVPGIGVSDFDKGLFYVIVDCDGQLDPQAALMGCGSDNTKDIGVTLDWYYVYKQGMQFISKMNSKCFSICEEDGSVRHFLMVYHMLRLAVEACDYDQLQMTWEKFLRASGNQSKLGPSGCGCSSI